MAFAAQTMAFFAMSVPVTAQSDEFVYISYAPNHPTSKRGSESLPGWRPKRRFVTQSERTNVKRVKERGGPCLRCKILKKQCDDEEPCKQCPEKISNCPDNHWKVIGCHRGDLSLLADSFKFSQGAISTGADENAEFETNDLKDKVRNLRLQFPFFRHLLGDCWSFGLEIKGWELAVYHAVINPAASREGFEYIWVAAWELITLKQYLVGPDCISDSETHNPVTLLRHLHWNVSNSEPGNGPHDQYIQREDNDGLVIIAVQLLTKSCIMCRNTLPMTTRKSGHLSTSKMEKAQGLQEDLRNFLRQFANRCCRRKCLSKAEALRVFLILCVSSLTFSIISESILVQSAVDQSGGLQDFPIHLNALYRTLVSVYWWAGPTSDPLLHQDVPPDPVHAPSSYEEKFSQSQQHARQWVRADTWEAKGVTSTKDFLLKLANGISNNQQPSEYTLLPFRQTVAHTRTKSLPTGDHGGGHVKQRLPEAIISSSLRMKPPNKPVQDIRSSPDVFLCFGDLSASLPAVNSPLALMAANGVSSTRSNTAISIVKAIHSLRSRGSLSENIKQDLTACGISPSSWKTWQSTSSRIPSIESQKCLQHFPCCGKIHATMNDLLDHMVACHAQQVESKPTSETAKRPRSHISIEDVLNNDQSNQQMKSIAGGTSLSPPTTSNDVLRQAEEEWLMEHLMTQKSNTYTKQAEDEWLVEGMVL